MIEPINAMFLSVAAMSFVGAVLPVSGAASDTLRFLLVIIGTVWTFVGLTI